MDTKLRIIRELDLHKQGTHLRELSRTTSTAMPNLLRFISILEKENVIKKTKDGNLVKIKLKKSERTLSYLKRTNTEAFYSLPKKTQQILQDFMDILKIKPLIIILFGSYAKGTYTSNSDLDLLLIYQSESAEKLSANTAKSIGHLGGIEINSIELPYTRFEKNFLDREHQFSREIRNNIIVLRGAEYYYELIWKYYDDNQF
jgi:predicted nucleotidyltransferase